MNHRGVAPGFLGWMIVTAVFAAGLVILYMVTVGPWSQSVCTYFGDTNLNQIITDAESPLNEVKYQTLKVGSCVESISTQTIQNKQFVCVKYKNSKDSNCKNLEGVNFDIRYTNDKGQKILEEGSYRIQISPNNIIVQNKI